MVDFNDIRKRPDIYIQASKNKNSSVDIERLLRLGESRLRLLESLEQARAQTNKIAEEIKLAGRPTPEQIEQGKLAKEKAKRVEGELAPLESDFWPLLYAVPNLPSEDTPVGADEDSNVVVREWGTPKKFNFEPKEHWQLGEALDVIDIERATKVSGSRFAYLKGDLALLQFALVQFGFQKLTDASFIQEALDYAGLSLNSKPFVPVVPPVLINPDPFHRMARLEPKEQRYYIPEDDQYLIGSAEHTLGAMHMDETFPESELPLRYVGYSTSFRREAGTYGKDMKGILRVHQFDKLEMESFTTAADSLAEQNLLVAIQELLMQALEIPYQVMICSTGDQGDPDARHLDLNSWLPGQNKYRETHSADLMTDYQTRRMNTRVKFADGRKELAHTNDATAFAIGRTLIAIMENYQEADGSISIPTVLQPFMGGKQKISKK